jgi:hypothetical protein
MPEQSTDATAKLKMLGERIRAGIAKQHPVADNSLDIVRQTVREEWQREQTAKRGKPSITPTKTRDRKPPEPER